MAQLAFTTNRIVVAEGAGQCTVYPGVEDLGYISFSY
jgi:hypothetical protein